MCNHNSNLPKKTTFQKANVACIKVFLIKTLTRHIQHVQSTREMYTKLFLTSRCTSMMHRDTSTCCSPNTWTRSGSCSSLGTLSAILLSNKHLYVCIISWISALKSVSIHLASRKSARTLLRMLN